MVVGGSAENYEYLQAHEVKDKSMREAGGTEWERVGGGVGGVCVWEEWEVVCVGAGGSPQTGPDARRLFVLKPGVSGPGHCFTLVKITSFIYFAHSRLLCNSATAISVLSRPVWPDPKVLLAEFLAQVCGPTTTRPSLHSLLGEQRGVRSERCEQTGCRGK